MKANITSTIELMIDINKTCQRFAYSGVLPGLLEIESNVDVEHFSPVYLRRA